jgi:hypothetical protein
VAENTVNKQSGLWIQRDHTLHIQCGNVTHYADGCANRDLILLRVVSQLSVDQYCSAWAHFKALFVFYTFDK